MPNLLKISQQTLWQITGKIVISTSAFIVLGMVARIYGEAGTGIFTLAMTYLAMFHLLNDFGFNAHLLRVFSKLGRVDQSKIWRRLLGSRILWAFSLMFLAIGLLPLWRFAGPQFSLAVVLGAFTIVGSSIFITGNLIFQSNLRYDLSIIASIFGTIIYLGIAFWLFSANYPPPYLLFAQTIGWMAIGLMSIILLQRYVNSVFPVYDYQFTLNLIKNSWPIAVTLALNVIYFRADAFILAYFRSSAEVGIYNVAYQVFQTALVLPTFIMNAYYPMMLKSLKGIRVVGLGLFLLAGFGTVLTLLLAPLLIKILTGSGFAGSSQALQILSLGFPAYFLSALLMWIMVTKGLYKKLLLVYALGLLINLALNFILIPQYTFYAASATTVISEYLILLMQGVVLFFEQSEKIPQKL